MSRVSFGLILAKNQNHAYGIGQVRILKELSERSAEYQCIFLKNRPELLQIDFQEAAY
jgi:hypothetical protein